MTYRLKVTNNQKFHELMSKTGIKTPDSLIDASLTLLAWAVDKTETGHSLVATRSDGERFQHVEFRSSFIDFVQQNHSERKATPVARGATP
jgi:hypothetical protein